MDMICFMHEGTPYGHLKVGNKVILPINLASMVGSTLEEVEGWLDELRQAKVFDVTEDGVMCSRRMIRDESIRNARAEGGKLGGNPSLVGGKVNLKVAQEDKQNPTPSSSSSSSSSSSIEVPNGTRQRETLTPAAPTEEIVALYNEKLPMLPRVSVVNESRRRAISARWREVVTADKLDREKGLEFFAWYFDMVSQSKFLTGKAKDWKADIDFLFNPSKFPRVIEGFYHKEQ